MEHTVANYVAYFLTPPRRAGTLIASSKGIAAQEATADRFISLDPQRTLLCSFVEQGNYKRNRSQWEALDKAIQYCKANNAHLLIPQLKKVITNPSFTARLLHFVGKTKTGTDLNSMGQPTFIFDLYCADYPSINRDNLYAILEHENRQREEHRRRIMMGLKNPNAKKSGNPNAAKVINMVNWPKTNNAIMFALYLQPAIEEYQKKGYSQRKMVQKLNEDNIHAPEGGQWVLSQLQKVLERIRINQAALAHESMLNGLLSDHTEPDTIAQQLNHAQCPPIRGKEWTPDQARKVCERLSQFNDILAFNQFVLASKPILEQCELDSLNSTKFLEEVDKMGISVPPILKRICK